MDAHDQETQQENGTRTDHWGNNFSPEQWGSKRTNHSPPAWYKWYCATSRPHRLKKTSSITKESKRRDLQLKWLHRETNDNTLPRWTITTSFSTWKNMLCQCNAYYHLRLSQKRDKFCAKFYFSNANGLLGGYVVKLTMFVAAYQHVLFTCFRSFQVFCESVRVLLDRLTFLLVLQWRQEKLTSLEGATMIQESL